MKKDMDIETQIRMLEEYGIKLREGIDQNILFEMFDREAYESDPFKLLMSVMDHLFSQFHLILISMKVL